MGRIAKFENYRFLGNRKNMRVYDCDNQDEFAQKLIEKNSGLAAAISTKINIAHQDKYYTDTEAMEQSLKSRGYA